MEQGSLVELYRRDRRKLLEFLVASGFIKQFRTPSGPATSLSDSDFDTLDVDYVLDCIMSGGVVDISVAVKKKVEKSNYPIMVQSQSGNSFYLLSDPDSARSPPRRLPPRIILNETTNYASCSSAQQNPMVEKFAKFGTDYGFKFKAAKATPVEPVENSKVSPLGLPSLNTVLSDDDLQESAYEILIASMLFSGIEVHSVEDRRKDKSSKLLSGLKSKKYKIHIQTQSPDRHAELIRTIRLQMQISEVMDASIRQRMLQLAPRRMTDHIDVPQILLGLLDVISKSDFPNEKSYMQWKSRQANLLEEFICFPQNIITSEHLDVRSSLAKIRDAKLWDILMSPSERAEVLLSIRQVSLKLSSLSGKFGVQSETYYWTSSYHLNIRLYEKLLLGVFDILDEGELITEADEILLLIKSTWSTLGITQKMHNAIFGWVLFQQFVGTDEAMLLESTTFELQKALSAADGGTKEGQYINSLVCSRQWNDSKIELTLMHAIFFSISIWYDVKLRDYHLYFSQKPCDFSSVMTLVSVVGVLTSGEYGETKVINVNDSNDSSSIELEKYVKWSTEAAYTRVANTIDLESKVKKMHPLTLLANELRLIADRELKLFFPVLCRWCPKSGMISAKLLHQFYREKLRPFLDEVSCLSEDVRSVLPAAHMLESDLTQLYTSTFEENRLSLCQDLNPYKIDEVSGPIILDWVIAQHSHVLEWTGRAFDLEDWEPLSFQQRHAPSIVEVFRILEETVHQFFSMNLPLDITHLQALLSVVFHSLYTYLMKMFNQLVEKDHLYPLDPPLTRYEETVIPIIKRKMLECSVLDDHVHKKLKELTISKLCIRLNTLQYIKKQTSMLEDDIRKSWAHVRPSGYRKLAKEELVQSMENDMLTCSEAVDELFITTFNSIEDTVTDAINKICGLTGARVVFWDLRNTFLFCLYRGNVKGARLDSVLPHVDTVLDHICGLIDDSLRDLVVLSIYQASLEGFAWVLLDGGPSRAFSDSDIMMMEDDLNGLKEFFVADGEGLLRSLVQQEAKFAELILNLFSLKTEIVIQMLINASENIPTRLDSCKHGYMEDAHTFIRVLCHKKDREASKFLKKQYQLPTCSEYDDTPTRDPTLRSPLVSDLLKRSTSFHWTKKGTSFQWTNRGGSSFKSIKKKLQEATSEIRNVAW